MKSERYAFASDLDGNKCLIAPAGTTDWKEWVVESLGATGSREQIPPKRGFDGHLHANAEASWPLEFLCHVEILIPGLDRFSIHPRQGLWCPQNTCPVCGWSTAHACLAYAERLACDAHEAAQRAARNDRARRLVGVAQKESDTSRYRVALTMLDAALDMYRSTGNAAAYADTLLDAGDAMLRFGLRTEALEALRATRRMFEQVGSRRNQASAAKLLADTLSDLGEFGRSIELYAEAQNRFLQLADWEMMVTIEMELGTVLQRLGRFRDASQRYKTALWLFQDMLPRRDLDIARCQQNLAVVLAKLGEFDHAQAALRDARAIYLRSGMVREATDCDVNLANALWRLGRIADARAINQEAQRVYRQLGLPTEAIDCADHIGAMLTDEGDYNVALPYHRQARAVYDEYYFDIDSAIATYNYAHALCHLGRYQEADTELKRAIGVFDSHNSEYWVATAELLRASVLASLGQHADAVKLVDFARQRLRSLDSEGESCGCDTIEGEILRKAGRARDAVPYLERAIAAYAQARNPIGAAEAELELAIALQDLGDSNATAHANRARELFQTLNLPLRAQEVSEMTGVTSSADVLPRRPDESQRTTD